MSSAKRRRNRKLRLAARAYAVFVDAFINDTDNGSDTSDRLYANYNMRHEWAHLAVSHHKRKLAYNAALLRWTKRTPPP